MGGGGVRCGALVKKVKNNYVKANPNCVLESTIFALRQTSPARGKAGIGSRM